MKSAVGQEFSLSFKKLGLHNYARLVNMTSGGIMEGLKIGVGYRVEERGEEGCRKRIFKERGAGGKPPPPTPYT